MGKKGSVKRFSDEERLRIIKKFKDSRDNNVRFNCAAVACDFQVGDKTILKIIQNADNIEQRIEATPIHTRDSHFRSSNAKFENLEQRLYDWIVACRQIKMPIPPSSIIAKSRIIAEELNNSDGEFKASNGWYYNFCKRKGLNACALYGEGGEVDKNNPKTLEALGKLYSVISQYDPERVYNMDETGLLYRVIPRYTVITSGENPMTTRGKKEAKDRVTLALCSNASGTHKLQLFFISSAKEPTCLIGKQLLLPYLNQKKTWQDSTTFSHWFDHIVTKEIRQRNGFPVLLLMDDAPSYDTGFERNGIQVVPLSSNMASWKQPMDMRIIASFKKMFRYYMLSEILSFHNLAEEEKSHKIELATRMGRGPAGIRFGRKEHLLDAAYITVFLLGKSFPGENPQLLQES